MRKSDRNRVRFSDGGEAPVATARYVRFACALLLAAAIVAAPVVMSGCYEGGHSAIDAMTDAGVPRDTICARSPVCAAPDAAPADAAPADAAPADAAPADAR